MIKRLYDLVTTIKGTSGTNDKLSILLANKDDNEFKRLLKYVYDPMMIYGVQKKKLDKHAETVSNLVHFTDFFQVFEYLLLHNTGKDSDVKLVSDYINQQDDQYREFLTECFTKKLKLGINSNSINKIFPNLISSFGVMLAKKYEDESHKFKGSFTLTEKIDGMRMIVIVDEGLVKCFSRQGQLIEGLVELEPELQLLFDGVYDGELVIKNYEQLKERDVLQETLKISRSKGNKVGLDYKIFDRLSLEEFRYDEFEIPYWYRRDVLELDFNNMGEVLEHIQLLPVLYQGSNQNVIPELLAQLEAEGKEGLMLNVNEAVYSTKRSSGILKIKSMNEFDERVTGVFEGTGKYKGMLGGVNLLYKGQYDLKCGSGFTDEQRTYYWNNPDELVGKIATIQYFRESKNQDGGLSVSFPVFRTVREDKNESSYY